MSVVDTSSWPKPNYVNPETRGPVSKIVQIVLIGLTTIVIALRLYTRQFISRTLGLDDALIVLSYIPAVGYAAVGIYGEVKYQWNRHTWDVNPRLFVPSLQASMAEIILFDLSTTLAKLSMLVMIYRLTSSRKSGMMRSIVQALATIISINCVAFLLVIIFQCNPISDFWSIRLPKRCINEEAHLFAAGLINTITDFVLVFLPVKLVVNLDLPRRQKNIVIGLFALGLLTCAAGVIRTVYTWFMFSSNDRVWSAWSVQLSSGIELFLAIISTSIPTIKLFFETYLPRWVDPSKRSKKGTIGYGDQRNRRDSSFGFNSPSTNKKSTSKKSSRSSRKNSSKKSSGINKVYPEGADKLSTSTLVIKPLPPTVTLAEMVSPLISPILSPQRPFAGAAHQRVGSFSSPLAYHAVDRRVSLSAMSSVTSAADKAPPPRYDWAMQQQSLPPVPYHHYNNNNNNNNSVNGDGNSGRGDGDSGYEDGGEGDQEENGARLVSVPSTPVRIVSVTPGDPALRLSLRLSLPPTPMRLVPAPSSPLRLIPVPYSPVDARGRKEEEEHL